MTMTDADTKKSKPPAAAFDRAMTLTSEAGSGACTPAIYDVYYRPS